MEYYDSHLHTLFSPDAPRDDGCTVDLLCQTAIEQGLRGIAVTDHYELLEPGEDNPALCEYRFDPAAHAAQVAQAKARYGDRLHIANGIELSCPAFDPDAAKALCENGGFDFVILSCHRDRGMIDFYDYMQEPHTAAEIRWSWETYLAELAEHIRTGCGDTLAHLTYPLRYYTGAGKADLIDFDARYRDYLADLLRLLIDRDLPLEVNTSGLRDAMGVTLPDEKVLALYRDLGGSRITVGSDAHSRQHVGYKIREAYARLAALGFRAVTVFEARNPIEIPLEF